VRWQCGIKPLQTDLTARHEYGFIFIQLIAKRPDCFLRIGRSRQKIREKSVGFHLVCRSNTQNAYARVFLKSKMIQEVLESRRRTKKYPIGFRGFVFSVYFQRNTGSAGRVNLSCSRQFPEKGTRLIPAEKDF
jgi:hypothetical protein